MRKLLAVAVFFIAVAGGYAVSAQAATCCDKDWVTGSGVRCHYCP